MVRGADEGEGAGEGDWRMQPACCRRGQHQTSTPVVEVGDDGE